MRAWRLLVFAKAPVPGAVKTRLVPPLTPEQAARVHTAALRDTVAAACAALPRDATELWVAGDAATAQHIACVVPGLRVERQGSGDLGARLADGFARSFQRGSERVVIVGSDHPTLPGERLREAFEALGPHPVVLGPSEDGGYYAVGLVRETWPVARGLFDAIPWSSAEVLSMTLARAAELGLRATLLPPGYDLDDAASLARVLRDAAPGSEIARLFGEPELAPLRALLA